ncbi:MAG TPA: 4'-phosphopantetheinyl transferase superfamily protein [bacterium]|nr:4'-phosphopantetheinyl transferase superfamily protein [bacterium]
MSPAVIEFCYGSSGKPSLGPCGSRHPLRFNLSHSEDTALYAVALGREVGVDIERIRTDVQTAELAGQFFSASERRALSSLAVADRTEAFFRCWTLKEAFIKAHGEGLSLPLEQFDVAFARGAPVAVIAIHGDTEDAARWSLREIPVEPRYVAAIAAAGNDWDLWCGEWSA